MAIALIEVDENELERLKIPFSLYGVYNKNASKELKAAFLEMAQCRKDMSKIYFYDGDGNRRVKGEVSVYVF